MIRKPWCVIGSLSLLAIAIILIAALVLNFWKRPALYNESCFRRSCLSELNMKCINNTCVCTSDQYYCGKCINKKAYMENCESSIFNCKSNVNLTCRDGYCKCLSSQYWDGLKCEAKRLYSQNCINDVQCLTDQMIYCDPINLKCSCSTNR